MAYYAEEDELYQEEAEVPSEHQMEMRLVQALGHQVQDFVNQTLIKGLKPFTQPLVRYGQRELMGCQPVEPLHRESISDEAKFVSRASGGHFSSAEILAEILTQMAASVLKDHEYGHGVSLGEAIFTAPSISRTEESKSSDPHSSDLDQAKKPAKRTHKTIIPQQSL
ncbi:hypothetical protein NDU88_005241 [Pleurodeles waltl]|uniref:Uncharacterized protein n=1 Tax=Pleurodeles waltl TaxID=8319 RepID=A0AAV7SLB2_PLEWA|nr:hypothetical protein NDU88_005241 [Pleurodeles waltl]